MTQVLDQGLKAECFFFHQFIYFKIKGNIFISSKNKTTNKQTKKLVFSLYKFKLGSFFSREDLWSCGYVSFGWKSVTFSPRSLDRSS